VNYTDKQFIAMPDFLNLKQQNLKYLDALTYLAIRSFDSNENDYCWPSYEKIMERSGLGRTFIATSIKRLEAARFFVKIEHSNRDGTCNRYYFGELEHFEQLSYDVVCTTIRC
jgi:RIO-like serine/threonine protein kinase